MQLQAVAKLPPILVVLAEYENHIGDFLRLVDVIGIADNTFELVPCFSNTLTKNFRPDIGCLPDTGCLNAQLLPGTRGLDACKGYG